ncbi:ATP-grasp domain-containing protein [Candidatus Curtissbacteria bacterium]|nr:ATP-grasp domain-containing protein [Candidatus Curtissbacteria bacterium]
MDKIYSRTLFAQAGLTVPGNVIVEKGKKPSNVWAKLKPLVFVKPRFQGSSVGTSIVKTKKDLKRALKLAYSHDSWAIVEEYLKGTEITCAILGNQNPKALPLVEIAPKKDYFDYEAKYDPNLTDEIVPARVSKELTKKAQQSALIAYKSIGCRGFARVDMIVKGGRVYVLEVNTIPGLTPVSLFPKAAKAAGISYPQLLDKIILFAMNP